MGKYGRWTMESLTMGSVIKGFTFKDRVYDIIDQFDFPEGVKDDAKRIAFDLSSEHTGRKTAVVCLYLSSQFNGFDFKERMDDVLEKVVGKWPKGFNPLGFGMDSPGLEYTDPDQYRLLFVEVGQHDNGLFAAGINGQIVKFNFDQL